MLSKLCVVCQGLDVTAGLDVAVDWDFAGGLEFAAGFENASGEAGHPCKWLIKQRLTKIWWTKYYFDETIESQNIHPDNIWCFRHLLHQLFELFIDIIKSLRIHW